MIWVVALILTLAVVIFVGYPLFVRESSPPEDALELAIAQRRGKGKRAAAAPTARGGVVCAGCGAANLPQDRFCAGCGAALGLRCPDCGAKFDAEDRFCAACGTTLGRR